MSKFDPSNFDCGRARSAHPVPLQSAKLMVINPSQADTARIACGAMVMAIVCLSSLALPMAEAFVAIALGLAMLAITATDIAEFRIPDWLSLPAICAGLLASGRILNPNTDDLVAYSHAIAAVIGGGSLWAIAALYAWQRGHDGLGFGDVKLAAAAGAWVGPDLLSLVLLLASSSALVAVLGNAWLRGQRVDLKGRVPFGAFLAPSIWIVWLIAATGLVT